MREGPIITSLCSFPAPSPSSLRSFCCSFSRRSCLVLSRDDLSRRAWLCARACVSPSPGQQSAHLPSSPSLSHPHHPPPPPSPSPAPPPRPQLPETRQRDDSRATSLLTLARRATCEGLARCWRSLARPPPGAVGAFHRSAASDAVSDSPLGFCVKILGKEKASRALDWQSPSPRVRIRPCQREGRE